ncbi:hypothetical protein SALBM217S_06168 [Streptomyces griseoloalbus]
MSEAQGSEAQGSGAQGSGARGFPAFAARRGGRARGQSFWAAQWTEAMEDVWPEEDPLKKGRSFARTGRIGPITVSPGRVAAEVYGGEETYTTQLTLSVLDDDEWDLLWERTADRPAETEALLAGDLPEDLLEAVEDARVRCCPATATSTPTAAATPSTTPARTPPPSPTSCPGCWTPTRGCCS